MTGEKVRAQLRVSGTTIPSKLAGSIVKTLHEGTDVTLMAIGANANNAVAKGMIVANSFLAHEGKKLEIVPAFGEATTTDNKEVTMLNWYLKLAYL